MLNILIVLLTLGIIISEPSCTKGEKNCILCNPMTKLCIECEYDIFTPDENGGCEKARNCFLGKNYCDECSEDRKLCKICEEGYFPDENGGCSYSNNCEISYKGKCLKCKENYILNKNINICKSLNLDDFKNCRIINATDGNCEECIEGYYLSSQDNRCTKTQNCSETTLGICTQCDKGFYLDKIEEKCKEQNGKLLYCKESLDGEKCNECEKNYYFDKGGICVNTNFCEESGVNGYCNKCISGYYLSIFSNTCTKTENCYTGINSVGICNKCKTGFYIDFKDGKCKSNQEENNFKNCAIAEDECLECYLGYYLGEDHKCTDNIYCAESNNGICIGCKENYYLGLDNKCSKVEHCIYSNYLECLECENSFYYDKDLRKCKIWDKNFENCKYGTENRGCERCKDEYYLNKTDKLCYNNSLNNSFYKCAITDDYGLMCMSCIDGYYLGYKYHRCSYIDGCVFQERDDKCLECNSFTCLDMKTGLCEDSNNKALKQYYKCRKTNEDGTACAQCSEGMTLDDEGFCFFNK